MPKDEDGETFPGSVLQSFVLWSDIPLIELGAHYKFAFFL
jgi:hypothetical protein